MMRKCTDCEIEKDEVEFKYGKNTRGYCRDCNKLKRKELYKKHKEKAEAITKTCVSCNNEKAGSEFYYSQNICKTCTSERDKESNHRPAEDAPPKTCNSCNKEQQATCFRYHTNICKTCEKERLYKWRESNPDKFKEICKKYRSKDDYREKQNTYTRNRYSTDSLYKLQKLYRNRVRNFIKGGVKKGKEKYTEMLGCSWETLRKWIEFNMVEGMTWENYGKVWHIDHTMPCAVFDFNIKESITECFNWSNLAPMFGEENLSKSDKLNMKLVNQMKDKAHQFIATHKDEILTDMLPDVLKGSILES